MTRDDERPQTPGQVLGLGVMNMAIGIWILTGHNVTWRFSSHAWRVWEGASFVFFGVLIFAVGLWWRRRRINRRK